MIKTTPGYFKNPQGIINLFGQAGYVNLVKLLDPCCEGVCGVINVCLGIRSTGNPSLFLNERGEFAASGGGSITADNGLTLTANNLQLGGNLIQNTSLVTGSNLFGILDNVSNPNVLFGVGDTTIVGGGPNNIVGIGTQIILNGTANIVIAALTSSIGLSNNLVNIVATDNTYKGVVDITDIEAAISFKATPTGTESGFRAIKSNRYGLTNTEANIESNDFVWSWPGVEGPAGSTLTTDGSGILTFQPGNITQILTASGDGSQTVTLTYSALPYTPSNVIITANSSDSGISEAYGKQLISLSDTQLVFSYIGGIPPIGTNNLIYIITFIK